MTERIEKTRNYLNRGYWIVLLPNHIPFCHTGGYALSITRKIVSKLLKANEIEEVPHSDVAAKFPATRLNEGDLFYRKTKSND